MLISDAITHEAHPLYAASCVEGADSTEPRHTMPLRVHPGGMTVIVPSGGCGTDASADCGRLLVDRALGLLSLGASGLFLTMPPAPGRADVRTGMSAAEMMFQAASDGGFDVTLIRHRGASGRPSSICAPAGQLVGDLTVVDLSGSADHDPGGPGEILRRTGFLWSDGGSALRFIVVTDVTADAAETVASAVSVPLSAGAVLTVGLEPDACLPGSGVLRAADETLLSSCCARLR